MKKFLLLIFCLIMSNEINGQLKVLSFNQQKVAVRKYDKEISRFWEFGLHLITNLDSRISQSQQDASTEKSSSLRQNLILGLFVTHGKQKYISDKWSLWFLASLSASPHIAPLWRRTQGVNNAEDYRISSQFSSSLELNYQLNKRISFFSQTGILLLATTTVYTKFSDGTKNWRFTFSGRLGGSSLQLAHVGMNYWLK